MLSIELTCLGHNPNMSVDWHKTPVYAEECRKFTTKHVCANLSQGGLHPCSGPSAR